MNPKSASTPTTRPSAARITSTVLSLALLLLAAPAFAQTYTLSPTAKFQFFTDGGLPCASCKVFTYASGTSTPATTYADSSGTPNTNPIILDAAGRATIYLAASTYKYVLTTAAGATIWTQDNIAAVAGTSSAQALNPFYYGTTRTTAIATTLYCVQNGSNAPDEILETTGASSVTITLDALANCNTGRYFNLKTKGTGIITLQGNSSETIDGNNTYVLGAKQTSLSVYKSSTGEWSVQATSLPLNIDLRSCDGRLTLTTGVPVTVTDVTAATTLLYTPYQGNRCALYNGVNWTMRSFAELSIAVPNAASQMYDVWLFDNAGVVSLELLAWTSDTARATALTTQDGVLVKTGALTRRYVGSFRTTTAAGQTEDSFSKRFVYNYYNRVQRRCYVSESTGNWTYTTATIRQANGSTSNQIAMVIGVQEDELLVHGATTIANTNTGVNVISGIGDNSTTSFAVSGSTQAMTAIANGYVTLHSFYSLFPTVGYHPYMLLEFSAATGTSTWYGNDLNRATYIAADLKN